MSDAQNTARTNELWGQVEAGLQTGWVGDPEIDGEKQAALDSLRSRMERLEVLKKAVRRYALSQLRGDDPLKQHELWSDVIEAHDALVEQVDA